MRFAGRAFLCRGRGEPHHRGRDVLRAGRVGPRLGLDDADHLELNGYAGEAIGAEGDLVLTLAGQNSVTESHAPDADITLSGMEVWGNLTLRGTGTLTADGLAVRDPRLAGARGGWMHRRCPGRTGPILRMRRSPA